MDKLADEVCLYQLKRIPESWYLKEGKTKEGDTVMPRRIDHLEGGIQVKEYNGRKKYTLLEKVVKVVEKKTQGLSLCMSGYSFQFDNIYNFC